MRVVPIYGRAGVGYGRLGIGYRRIYDNVTAGRIALSQPSRRAITLRIYDTEDLLVAQVSSNAEHCTLLALTWELLDTGCGSFDVELGIDLGITHDWRIDVHLWNDPKAIYSGFVQRVPQPGSSERTYSYGGYGFLSFLNRMTVTNTYPAQAVRSIVQDLAGRMETRLVRVKVDQEQIEQVYYAMVGDLKFLRTPVKVALKQLADLAGGYEWGVDADRTFFFRPPVQDIDLHSWVGRHLETWTPQEESDDIINLLYVKGGKVRSDLPTTDPFYKTNWIPDSIQDDDSISLYGIREGEYSAPSVLNLIDALWAGKVEMDKKKVPRQYASVRGLIYNGERLSCRGQARIVGRGGQQLILPKKKLKFAMKGERVEVNLDLGDLDYTSASMVAHLAAYGAAESLARQQSQQQL